MEPGSQFEIYLYTSTFVIRIHFHCDPPRSFIDLRVPHTTLKIDIGRHGKLQLFLVLRWLYIEWRKNVSYVD